MKREYYKRAKYGDPYCPPCDVEMDQIGASCGDYDDLCECDVLYACSKCGWRLVVACTPHEYNHGFECDDEMGGDDEEKLPLKLDPPALDTI